jgi:hypothetical protein
MPTCAYLNKYMVSVIKQLIRCIAICLFVWGNAYAQKTVASSSWHAIENIQWSGHSAGKGKYDLSKKIVEFYLPLDQVKNKWVRFKASSPADTPDFHVWIHSFDQNGRPLARPLPTSCEIHGKQKICSNTAKVWNSASKARLALYTNIDKPTFVTPEEVEISDETQLTQTNIDEFLKILEQIKSSYFKTTEVDWSFVRDEAKKDLTAPIEINPIPHAIAHVVALLPDSRHMRVYRTENRQHNSLTSVEFSTCKPLGKGVWRLNMPGTPNRDELERHYVKAARNCFVAHRAKKWIIDMRSNSGGNAMAQFAALAPVFGVGDVMKFVNPSKEDFIVHIGDKHVSINENISVRMPSFKPISSQVEFMISDGCVSSCEAVVIAAKGRFKVAGQPTAGYTTANESLPISQNYFLPITTGWMADLAGKTFDRVEPDYSH